MRQMMKQKVDGTRAVRRKSGLSRMALALGAAALLATPLAFAGGGSGAVPTKVTNSCMICHGMTGENTLYPIIPRLAGQQAQYITQQLKQFKTGVRDDPNANLYMLPVAQSLDGQQRKQLAKYFAKQAPMQGVTGGSLQEAKAGKQIFMQGIPEKNVAACMACHGIHAQGSGAFPRLAGQRFGYIVAQLGYFKSGARKSQIMQAIVSGLNNQQMKDVAAYVTRLK